MRKLVFITACMLLAGCTASRKNEVVKGEVLDATMNTLIIVSEEGDTLSFVTMNADRENLQALLIGDTIEVHYAGKYRPDMEASALVSVQDEAEWCRTEITLFSGIRRTDIDVV